jgi:subtilisin family serine protease
MYRREPSRRGTRAAAERERPRPAVQPGILVIKFEAAPAAIRSGRRLAAHTAIDDSQRRHIQDRLRFLRDHHGLKDIVPIVGERRRQARRPARSLASTEAVERSVAASTDNETAGLMVVRIDPKADLEEVARELRGRGVEYVEPAPTRRLAARSASLDPSISKQWGLQAIGWYSAKRPSAKDVGVAVLDSGIDEDHPDLKGAIEAYDDCGLGRTDRDGHGTHVAGIIAAVANNKIGIAGVSNARLHCWKVFPDNEDADDAIYYQALGEVADDPSIKVLNLSMSGEGEFQTERNLLRRLRRKGVLVVAAMGNEFEEGNPTEYPAAYDGVMAVGSVGPDFERSYFSNVGSHISIVAPGENILSTLPRKGTRERRKTKYGALDGTSMATPFVAGAAALVFARFPGYGPGDVQKKLEQSVVKPEFMKKPRDKEYGYGALNLSKALSGGQKKK